MLVGTVGGVIYIYYWFW